MAYELCVKTPKQTNNAQTISALVLKCKKAKWDVRERERLRRRNELVVELEDKLMVDRKREISEIEEKVAGGEMGEVEGREEKVTVEELSRKKIDDLRQAFAISDPVNLSTREVPDYLVDPISFEIMHDRKC
jgi:STIP1 homology and U-box containing protein 1